MVEKSLTQLKNGSDVRGVALQEEGGAPVTLSPEAAGRIAASFAAWLQRRLGKQSVRVGVGHDSRLTAQSLKEAVIGGLCARGAQVFDCGLASTPAMFMGTVFAQTRFDGSIMITASHLPKNRNGMKFFTGDGGLDGGDITALLEGAADMEYQASGSGEPSELMKLYSSYLRDKIVQGADAGDKPLEGLHIVVDAGNGAGGFFVGDVLELLGADCSGSQFLDPDGSFPNHQPNPENKEAMASIQNAVKAAGADMGIIFDTDVDRMSAVLGDGQAISRNTLLAMMAAILAPEYPGSTIVTDSITSHRLTAFLERLGLRHHCFKRGYKNVINEAIRLNSEGTLTPLAIETSGHGALKENYFLDDGAYMAVRMLSAAARAKGRGKTLESLLEGYDPQAAEREVRLTISGDKFGEYGKQVLESFRSRAEEAGIAVIPSYEGVRLSFGEEGWAMLRMSLHDPILPLNLESGTEQGLCGIQSQVAALLRGFDRIDTSGLQQPE